MISSERRRAHRISWALFFGGLLVKAKAGDFDFDAAELGVVVFADAVGNVDEAALFQSERCRLRCEIPADSAHAAASTGWGWGLGRVLSQILGKFLDKFEADVALFHEAGRCGEANAARDKDGLWVAVAKRLQFAEPSDEHWGDAVEGELGVDAENVFRLAVGEMFGGVGAQAEFQLGQILGGHGKADSEGVAAKTSEEAGAAFQGIEELEPINATTGTMGDAVFNADNNGGLGGAFDHARGEDADDTAMPAVAVDEQEVISGEFFIAGQTGLDGGEG